MKNKLFGIFAILLMIFGIAQNPILATPYTEITDPTSWTPSIRDLVGTSSVGTWTLNSTAEYYEAPVNVTTNGTCWIAEFQVPDCYMGMDVWKWNGSAWVLMNGQTGYSLSVPYYWNYTDKIDGSTYTTSIPADWGSGSFVVGTPSAGSLYRVQLRVDESAQLKIQVRYATTPRIGFDGINDFVRVISVPYDELDPEQVTVAVWSRVQSLPVEYSLLVGRYARYPYSMRVHFSGYLYVGYTFNDSSYVVEPTSYFVPLNVMNFYAMAYDGNVLKMYVNDSAVYSKTIEKPLLTGTNNNVSIGALKVNDWTTKGGMGAVCIYNRSLSSQEISALYQGREVNRTGLVLEFLLGNINGTTWYDSSGNGNHGTPYGNVQYKVYTETGFKVTIERFSQVVNEGGSDEFVVYSTQPISSTSWDWKSGKLVVQSYGNITVNCTKGARLPFTVWYDSGDGWRAYGADFPPFTAWTNGSAIIYEFYSIPSGSFMIDFADADTTGYVPPPVNGGGGGGGGGGGTTIPPVSPPVDSSGGGSGGGDGGDEEETVPRLALAAMLAIGLAVIFLMIKSWRRW